MRSELPPWGRDELPEPLPFTPGNILKTIGPGAILLAASIGGGEWLVGPAAAVKHGVGIFWIATVAIVLQLFFNLEALRYTLYTGEPVITGFMRLAPGSRFWSRLYAALTVIQLGVPALAVGCAPVLFSLLHHRLPDEQGANNWQLIALAYLTMALGVLLLTSGSKIERTLERVSWAMILYIFVFLLFVNLWFVPPAQSWQTLLGFVQFGTAPRSEAGEVDMLLLATLAATAGAGGIGNLTLSNWARDKGMGMGARVGAIESTEGDPPAHQAEPVGKVFELTPENLARWRTWWRYVNIDQCWLWAGGCFLGMYLNVNLALAISDPSRKLDGLAAGAYQAEQMARQLGDWLWYAGLLNGFWILFSTHLGNTDAMVRNVTDILWTANPATRRANPRGILQLYRRVLALVTVFGACALLFGKAMELFKFLGFMANVILALGSLQLLAVNHWLMPRPLRAAWWRQVMLVICCLFYSTSTVLVVWQQFQPKPVAAAAANPNTPPAEEPTVPGTTEPSTTTAESPEP